MARPGIGRQSIGYPFKGRFPGDDFQAIFRELPLVADFGDEVQEATSLEARGNRGHA